MQGGGEACYHSLVQRITMVRCEKLYSIITEWCWTCEKDTAMCLFFMDVDGSCPVVFRLSYAIVCF